MRERALPPSQDRTGPPCGDEPRVLKGRRGGTDEFLGRGLTVPQSPWPASQGGRPLDKCLVHLHADTVIRKSPATVSEAVNSSPVMTPRKKNYSSPVRGAPVDKRGHIRVRRCFSSIRFRHLFSASGRIRACAAPRSRNGYAWHNEAQMHLRMAAMVLVPVGAGEPSPNWVAGQSHRHLG
jgi:hypothetical protein